MKKSFVLLFIQACKFGAVGVMNTLITLVSIFVLMRLGVHYLFSNGIGYSFGFVNSFIMNKYWTFQKKGATGKQAILFVIGFLVCYAVQLGIVYGLVRWVGISEYVAQLIGNVVYTASNFVFHRHITFS